MKKTNQHWEAILLEPCSLVSLLAAKTRKTFKMTTTFWGGSNSLLKAKKGFQLLVWQVPERALQRERLFVSLFYICNGGIEMIEAIKNTLALSNCSHHYLLTPPAQQLCHRQRRRSHKMQRTAATRSSDPTAAHLPFHLHIGFANLSV